MVNCIVGVYGFVCLIAISPSSRPSSSPVLHLYCPDRRSPAVTHAHTHCAPAFHVHFPPLKLTNGSRWVLQLRPQLLRAIGSPGSQLIRCTAPCLAAAKS